MTESVKTYVTKVNLKKTLLMKVVFNSVEVLHINTENTMG